MHGPGVPHIGFLGGDPPPLHLAALPLLLLLAGAMAAQAAQAAAGAPAGRGGPGSAQQQPHHAAAAAAHAPRVQPEGALGAPPHTAGAAGAAGAAAAPDLTRPGPFGVLQNVKGPLLVPLPAEAGGPATLACTLTLPAAPLPGSGASGARGGSRGGGSRGGEGGCKEGGRGVITPAGQAQGAPPPATLPLVFLFSGFQVCMLAPLCTIIFSGFQVCPPKHMVMAFL
jgi:hypothetical protein